jgi:uncharacterized repeat protein (TIGR04138 family)
LQIADCGLNNTLRCGRPRFLSFKPQSAIRNRGFRPGFFIEVSVDPKILELCREDQRFAYEAYEFVCEAVTFTQDRLGRGGAEHEEAQEDHHVCGAELLRGTCDLAIREFGMMAPVVFKLWGVRTTDHVGEIVFKLISVKRLSKSDRDDPEDFRDLFDLYQALADGFALTLSDTTAKRGDR